MAITGISSSGYNFGNLESIRKQAQAIQDRVDAESAARKAEQERTGLIRNPDTGEMVELDSVSEWQRDRWERREQANSVSPHEAMIGFMATDPNAESVERSKQMAAKYAPIQQKMLAGKKLTGEEKAFLQENYPAIAAIAERMEQEAEQLERSLQRCESKDEARQVYMEAKTRIMGTANKEDSSVLFLLPTLDRVYNEYLEKGKSGKKTEFWA